MKKHISLGANLVLLIAIAVCSGQTRANAQVYRPGGGYYETKISENCATSFACYLHYPRASTRFWLMVEKVSCSLRRSTPVRTVHLGVTNGPTDSVFARSIVIQPFLASTTDVNNYLFVNDVHFLIAPGKYPAMFADTSQADQGFFTCTLTGTLLDSP